MENAQVWHAHQSFFEFLNSKARHAICKWEVGKVTSVQQPEECITQEGVIVHVVSTPDAVVCEGTVVTHHFNACMTPTAVMCTSTSNTPALYTHLVSFNEASVTGEFILALWIPRANEDGHVVVENSVSHHVEGEKRMPPP